jgi:hypothetical protein
MWFKILKINMVKNVNLLYSGWVDWTNFSPAGCTGGKRAKTNCCGSCKAAAKCTLIKSYNSINFIKLMKSINVVAYKQREMNCTIMMVI